MPLFRTNARKSTTPRNLKTVLDSFNSGYEKGRDAEKEGRKEEALNFYKNALSSINSINVELIPEADRESISNILFKMGSSFLNLGDFEQSKSSFELGKRYGPTNVKGVYSYTRLLMEKNEHLDLCESILDETAKSFPNDYEAHNALAQVYEKEGKKDESIASYERALELNPTSADIALKLMTFCAGDYDKEKKYLEYLKKSGDRERILDAYVRIIFEGKVEVLDEAKTELPNEPRLTAIEAKILIDKGKIDEAKTLLTDVLQKDPDSVEANILMGYIDVYENSINEELPLELKIVNLLKSGKTKEAIELARQSGMSNEDIFFIALKGKDYEYATKMSTTFHSPIIYKSLIAAESDPDEAEKEINLYVSKNQKDPLAWLVKSIIADYKNNEAGSKNFLNMALKLDPSILKENYLNRYRNFRDREWFIQSKK